MLGSTCRAYPLAEAQGVRSCCRRVLLDEQKQHNTLCQHVNAGYMTHSHIYERK
jgi:hypothetical protein